MTSYCEVFCPTIRRCRTLSSDVKTFARSIADRVGVDIRTPDVLAVADIDRHGSTVSEQ
jgi:hypothetical protein